MNCKIYFICPIKLGDKVCTIYNCFVIEIEHKHSHLSQLSPLIYSTPPPTPGFIIYVMIANPQFIRDEKGSLPHYN